jgi:hypothetical protein
LCVTKPSFLAIFIQQTFMAQLHMPTAYLVSQHMRPSITTITLKKNNIYKLLTLEQININTYNWDWNLKLKYLVAEEQIDKAEGAIKFEQECDKFGFWDAICVVEKKWKEESLPLDWGIMISLNHLRLKRKKQKVVGFPFSFWVLVWAGRGEFIDLY